MCISMRSIIKGGDRRLIYKELLRTLELSDRGDTDVQKYINQSLNDFDLLLNDSCVYYLEASLCATSFHARQMSLLLLKKGIAKKWPLMDEPMRLLIKNGIVKIIQSQDVELRSTIASAYVALFTAEGFDKWPESLIYLLQLFSSNEDEVILETVVLTLGMILEDTIATSYIRLTDNYIEYVQKILVPALLNLSLNKPKLLKFTSRLLSILLDTQVGSEVLFNDLFQLLWNTLGSMSKIKESSINKCMIKGTLKVWDIYPLKVLESSHLIFPLITQYSYDASDHTLQIEALDFWIHILRTIDIYTLEVKTCLVERLKVELPSLIKVLIDNTKYSSLDYMSMDKSHLEDDNASVPDTSQDVYTFVDDDDDNETTTWGNTWTVRKGSALALDYISTVYGSDEEVLSLMLTHIQKKLDSTDWEVKESAMLSLSAIARGSLSLLSPYLPQVMRYLIQVTNDRKPLLRIISCWCISRFVSWIYHPDNKEWLEPVLSCILGKMLDCNKRVQESACSAFTAFEENGGHLLAPYVDGILTVVLKALAMYQARNFMILYDVIGTLAENVGKDPLLASPHFNQLISGVIAKVNDTCMYTPQFLAILECTSCLARCLREKLADFAPSIIKRAMMAILQILIDAKQYETEACEPPRWDVLEASVDAISAVVSNGVPITQVSRLTLETSPEDYQLLKEDLESIARSGGPPAEGKPIVLNLQALILLSCASDVPGVLQSCLALVGDLVWNSCTDVISNEMVMVQLRSVDSTVSAVSNNSTWSVGVFSLNEVGRAHLEPHLRDFVVKLSDALLKCDEIILKQNLCITLGRLCLAFPEKLGVWLNDFLSEWCIHLIGSRNDQEKAQALHGVCLALFTNPGIGGAHLSDIANLILGYPPYYPQLETCMKQLMALYIQSYPSIWDTISPQIKEKIKLRFQF